MFSGASVSYDRTITIVRMILTFAGVSAISFNSFHGKILACNQRSFEYVNIQNILIARIECI